MPGPLALGIPVDGLALSIDSKVPIDPGDTPRCWRYTAPILPPNGLNVTPGECYWLEITGLGENQPGGYCQVNWLSSFAGNHYCLRDSDGVYEYSDIVPNDQALCIDSGILGASDPPDSHDGGCGNLSVACCRPGGECQDGDSLSECVGAASAPLAGAAFPFATCHSVNAEGGCPTAPFDSCNEAAVPLECQNQLENPNLGYCTPRPTQSPWVPDLCDFNIGVPPRHDCPDPNATCNSAGPADFFRRCRFETDNRLALSDGPNLSGSDCFPSGVNSLQADVWFKYVVPCSNGYVTIRSCDPEYNSFDSMLQVFGNHSSTCPACPILDNSLERVCNDDSCGASAGGSMATLNALQGECLTIRYGGWSHTGSPNDAAQNVSGLNVEAVCCPFIVELFPPAPAFPANDRRNRYIAFRPQNAPTEVAFRVDKVTAPSGTCWVDAPDALGNSKCVPDPVYRVWLEQVVYVGDCEIVPNAEYRVYLDALPQGLCLSGGLINIPLVLRTTAEPVLNNKKWGDLAGTNNGVEWTPPNQFTNVNDVLAVLAYITNAAIKPTFQQANLQAISSVDPCLNAFVNTADVLIVVKASAGDSYPFTTDPANCPVCP